MSLPLERYWPGAAALCVSFPVYMRVNAQEIDRLCAGVLRWLLIGFLCLIGVVLLMVSLAMIAAVEPAPAEMIKKSRAFGVLWFFIAVAWFSAVGWFAFFLHRRGRRNELRN